MLCSMLQPCAPTPRGGLDVVFDEGHVPKELLGTELSASIIVAGVATDDPTQPFTHPQVRLWRYPHIIDQGRFRAHSHHIPIPPGINPIQMHRITWPQMGPFLRQQVRTIVHPSGICNQALPSECFDYNLNRRGVAQCSSQFTGQNRNARCW